MASQVAIAAAVTPTCSRAPAEPSRRRSRSASPVQPTTRTANGAGTVGPSSTAMSTTEVENAITASTGRRSRT